MKMNALKHINKTDKITLNTLYRYTQGPDAEDPIDAFTDIYIVPWTRCPVYFMGMLLGYLYYKTGGKIKMPKVDLTQQYIISK